MDYIHLKDEIKAYLEDKSVLTEREKDELLLDCFIFFEEQDRKKADFRKTYEVILSNAKKQKEEASEMLKGFGQLTEILKRANSAKEDS